MSANFSSTAVGVNPGACSNRRCFSVNLQAVNEKGDQNVRVGAMLRLMADRAYAEFTLERSKYRFDLGQLHVARPQHAGISRGNVGAQQVVSVVPFRLLEFVLIYTKPEGLARQLLLFPL